MQIVSQQLAVISDTVHRAYFHRPLDIFFLAWICRLLKDIVVGRVVAVHKILKCAREADAAAVASARDKVLPGDIFFQPDSNRRHTNLLLPKCRKPIVAS